MSAPVDLDCSLNRLTVATNRSQRSTAPGHITADDVRRECQLLRWQVDEFQHPEQLISLRTTWNRLAEKTPGYSHFLTYDWLATYWQHMAGDQRLRILVVRTAAAQSNQETSDWADETIVGILPLVVRTELTKLGHVQVLTYPLHGWGTIYGPIGPCPDLTLHHASKYLAQQSRDYDLLDLRWVDNRRGLGDLTASAFQNQSMPVKPGLWFDTYQVNLSSNWVDYWSTRTSHWRTNVRSNLKKISQLGNVEYLRYRPSAAVATANDPRWDLYDQCTELAKHSWQGQRTDGTTLSHPAVADYLRAAHQTAVNLGSADINLLMIDQRPVAFAYNYAVPGYLYGLRAGYHPEFKGCGAGSVLMYHMLRDSSELGDCVLDLGPGNMPSKQPWLNEVVPCYRYTHYPRGSWRAWGLWAKHRWDESRQQKTSQ